jgi:hypothetical protein
VPTGTAGRQKRPGLGVCTGACDDCTFARDRRGRVARRLPGPGSQARSGVRVRRDPRTICSGCRARSRRNRSGNSTTARTGGERTRVRWAWPRTNIACGAGRPPAGVSWRKGHLTRSEGDVGARLTRTSRGATAHVADDAPRLVTELPAAIGTGAGHRQDPLLAGRPCWRQVMLDHCLRHAVGDGEHGIRADARRVRGGCVAGCLGLAPVCARPVLQHARVKSSPAATAGTAVRQT